MSDETNVEDAVQADVDPADMSGHISLTWARIQFILSQQGSNSYRDDYLHIRWNPDYATWYVAVIGNDGELILVAEVTNEFEGMKARRWRPGQWLDYLDETHDRIKTDTLKAEAQAERAQAEAQKLAFSPIDDAAIFAEQRPVPKADPEPAPEPEPEPAPGIVCVTFLAEDKESGAKATEVLAERIGEGYRIVGMTGEKVVTVLMQRGGQGDD